MLLIEKRLCIVPCAGVAKFTPPKLLAREPENDTDPDEALKKMKDNDKSLTDLNLNNIRVSINMPVTLRLSIHCCQVGFDVNLPRHIQN